jgi:hypothetical protein
LVYAPKTDPASTAWQPQTLCCRLLAQLLCHRRNTVPHKHCGSQSTPDKAVPLPHLPQAHCPASTTVLLLAANLDAGAAYSSKQAYQQRTLRSGFSKPGAVNSTDKLIQQQLALPGGTKVRPRSSHTGHTQKNMPQHHTTLTPFITSPADTTQLCTVTPS